MAAEYLARGIPRILNVSILGLLRPTSGPFPPFRCGYYHPYLGGNGRGLWSNQSLPLFATCRHKSGGPLNLGSSAGKRVDNGELYGALQIGKTSKKFKSKRKNLNLIGPSSSSELQKHRENITFPPTQAKWQLKNGEKSKRSMNSKPAIQETSKSTVTSATIVPSTTIHPAKVINSFLASLSNQAARSNTYYYTKSSNDYGISGVGGFVNNAGKNRIIGFDGVGAGVRQAAKTPTTTTSVFADAATAAVAGKPPKPKNNKKFDPTAFDRGTVVSSTLSSAAQKSQSQTLPRKFVYKSLMNNDNNVRSSGSVNGGHDNKNAPSFQKNALVQENTDGMSLEEGRVVVDRTDPRRVRAETMDLDLDVAGGTKWIPDDAYWIKHGFDVEPSTSHYPSSSTFVHPSPNQRYGGGAGEGKSRNVTNAIGAGFGQNDGQYTARDLAVKKNSKTQSQQPSTALEYNHLLYNEMRHQNKRNVSGGWEDQQLGNNNSSFALKNDKADRMLRAQSNVGGFPKGFVMVENEGNEKYYKKEKKKQKKNKKNVANLDMQSKRGDEKNVANESFSSEVDELIQAFQIDRWENMVQKSLLDTHSTRNPPQKTTAFVLVNDETSGSPSAKGESRSKNVSTVPNNTAHLSNQVRVRELKPDVSRKLKKGQSGKGHGVTRSKSEPVLSVQPAEIINRKKAHSTAGKSHSSTNLSAILPSTQFYSGTPWSKELLAAVEKTQRKGSILGNTGLNQGLLSSSKTTKKEIWSSSEKLLNLKNAKRNKKENKLKDGNAVESRDAAGLRGNDNSGFITNDAKYSTPMAGTARNDCYQTGDNLNAAATVPGSLVDGCSGGGCGSFSKQMEQNDLVKELKDQLKAEFRQGFLEMQKERLIKKSLNSKPKQPTTPAEPPMSTLMYTPNSLAKWEADMQLENSRNIDGLTKAQKKAKINSSGNGSTLGSSAQDKKLLSVSNDSNNGSLSDSDALLRRLISERDMMMQIIKAKIPTFDANTLENDTISKKKEKKMSKKKNKKKNKKNLASLTNKENENEKGVDLNKKTYYVLSGDDGAFDKFEDFAKKKDEHFFNESVGNKMGKMSDVSAITNIVVNSKTPINSANSTAVSSSSRGQTKGLFPMLDKLDGLMTMTLTPVYDSPQQVKTESEKLADRRAAEQAADILENHRKFEKERLERNILAMRRYQERQQIEKEEKKKKRKNGNNDNKNKKRNGEKSQRNSLRKIKSQAQ